MDTTDRDIQDHLSSMDNDILARELVRRVVAEKRMVPVLDTYMGGVIDLLDPKPEQITLDDIANGLSRECRFAKQLVPFYSVAQHSWNVSNWIGLNGGTVEEQLAGLFHDASEAYIGDIPRPLKQLLPQYKIVETQIMIAISLRFDLRWPLPKIVHDADTVMLCSEAHLHLRSKQSINVEHGYPTNHAELALPAHHFLSTPYDSKSAAHLWKSRAEYLFERRKT